jgi:hypothetical protein
MTEYVVDFGDSRSNEFVRLNMAMVEQNGAMLHERVVRCGECRHCMEYMGGIYCGHMTHAIEPNGFCAWGERRGR